MINPKNILENNCDTGKRLMAYLCEKGKNHNHYKCYSSFKNILSIKRSKFLYLSTGETWNDITDRNSFNNSSNNCTNFGKCFSFSQDESVAMWMLYGGIDKLSGMIDFTKKGMQSILETSTISVGYFENNAFVSLCELKRNDFEIFITDIIYYKKNGEFYYINRYDESFSCLSEEVFQTLNGCKKAYPWKYENECRLIVSIKNELFDKKCSVVRINLADLDLGKSFERVYRGPNNPLRNDEDSLPSKLDNTIDWSLCDGKNCIQNYQKEIRDNGTT